MEYSGQEKNRITCGEYLNMQRGRLDLITDLNAPGAKEEAKDLLANIYAVNYQMMYERLEPPGPDRGPATREPLDTELVGQVSRAVRDGSREFQEIVNDPRTLDEAIYRSRQGNGFQLVEMVNMAHMARAAAGKPAQENSAQKQAGQAAAEQQLR